MSDVNAEPSINISPTLVVGEIFNVAKVPGLRSISDQAQTLFVKHNDYNPLCKPQP